LFLTGFGNGKSLSPQAKGMAEVGVSGQMFADILSLIRPAAGTTHASMTRALVQMRRATRGEVCADMGKRGAFCVSVRSTAALITKRRSHGR
jgi:hypothetical protein